MKTIIAGGRNYKLTADDWRFLDALPITRVISGCARGADKGGESWAEHHSVEIDRFPADWDKYGKKAGWIRNNLMAQAAEAVVLFPGGRGTDMMHRIAVSEGLIVHDRRGRQ